ncbi:hypothetical protein NPIL_108331 [Nephila pilipes]|uniref:Uncharacterized protein n=1 Tax=Nephila pilipes TaxID=299642 RepID=A0A8X6NFC2_NEPPI|nr:hypothetical protein NPIL_108331 [Nephila pilipes]
MNFSFWVENANSSEQKKDSAETNKAGKKRQSGTQLALEKERKKILKLEESKRINEMDRTEKNVAILLKLSNMKPKPVAAQKVLDFHLQQQKKRVKNKEEARTQNKEPEPESILFPEENERKKKRKKKKDYDDDDDL